MTPKHASVPDPSNFGGVHHPTLKETRLGYGRPCLEGALIPTRVLKEDWEAYGRNTQAVARLYKIRPKDVTTAVDFEHTFTKAA